MNWTRQLLKRCLTACLPSEMWFIDGRQLAAGRSWISLTFDDGPHPEGTVAVLDALRRWNLTGTFFVIGQQAEAFPDLIARIVDEGHEIGNHTWSHSDPAKTTATQLVDEIDRTNRCLRDQACPQPRWFRPPKGSLSVGKLAALFARGERIALWNVDPRDYRMTTKLAAQTWADSYRPVAGDVVLLHDRLAWAADIIQHLGERGVFSNVTSVPLSAWSRPSQTAVESAGLEGARS